MQLSIPVKSAFAGLALTALLPGPGGAQVQSVLDDFEGGTNQNRFLAYWYYYNDSGDGGTSAVNSATPSGAELLFDPAVSLDVGATGGKAALLDFTMGANKPTCGPACTYGQFVGMGTGFVPDGQVLDMTGATHITFKAKADAPLTVVVEVTTKPITTAGTYAYHLIEIGPIETTWGDYTVPLTTEGLTALTQPAWYLLSNPPDPFDITQVEKIQWKVSVEQNIGLTAGKLWVDDVVVHGYQWVPPTACMTCLAAPGMGTGAVLSDMDTAPKNRNAVGFYWYAYNDAAGRVVASPADYTEIYGGVLLDTLDPTKPLLQIVGNKGYNMTDGAFIEFTLGPTFPSGGETVKPFAGIGTKVSDELGTSFMNASTATGVSFDYMASGDIDYIRFEVHHSVDFGNEGIVHHVLLPNTAGQWQSASIMWTDLKLPAWDIVALIPDPSLRTNSLDKFQWAYQGTPGQSGALAVDNVKLMGLTVIDSSMIAGIMPRAGGVRDGFGAEMLRSGLRVSFNLPGNDYSGVLELRDLRGTVLSRTHVNAGEGLRRNVELRPAHLADGVYLLNLSTRSAHGRPFSRRIPVTYVN